ncbi:MAG: PAS domain-containing protein [Campylobacterales bacterium]|nr:PAS domain-containing protein [Campylobacterales bacterium]
MSESENTNEIEIGEGTFLITRTDLNGAITYANEDFCSITGYQREDLIGQNHNIIRHPDMPLAVFADLWKTIKSNKKWKGFIKNKTKDDKFYWVEAEVSPFVKNGRHIGYKSIRKRAPKEVIKQAEIKYSNIRKDETGEFNSWTIEKENYKRFDALSKKLKLSKKQLFEKMLSKLEK